MTRYKFFMVAILPGIVLYPIVTHLAISFTDSVGGHIFWRKDCNEVFHRWDLVEVVPDPEDPFLPNSHGQPIRLIKKIACFPGETVLREGLRFWCKGKDTTYDLGLTKLKTRDGKPIQPFSFTKGERYEFMVPEDTYFLLGKPDPGSYDSRYFGPVEKERITGCFKQLF